ncbi:MAG: helix-turn-helix domain-containing protein, partial [Desulfuromonadales bacterium]|nr:helix-turn-helix domain-containing protein [Desulfuromonadales bacterium]
EQQVKIPKEERFAARPSLGSLMTMSSPMNRSERDTKTYRAYRDFGYTLKEIADFLDVHYATVSRVIKRVETDLLDCKT